MRNLEPRIYRRLIGGKPLIGPPFGDWTDDDGVFHPGQTRILDKVFSDIPEDGSIKFIDLCCGIGYGKTTVGVDIAQAILGLGPQYAVLFLEPNVRGINRNFLPAWRAAVPEQYYRQNKGEREMIWKVTGAHLFYDHRDVTGNVEAAADRLARGPTVCAIIDDEAATGYSDEMRQTLMGRLRGSAEIFLYITLSTPKPGSYGNMLALPGHVTVKCKTVDNPTLSRARIAQLKQDMSPEMFRRECEAEIISLQGRIWSGVDYHPTEGKGWPYSNRDDAHPAFDNTLPWYLFADIGSATGAYACVQPTLATYNGREIFPGKRWVLFAEYCPQDDADVHRAFLKLRASFGTPAGLVAGIDINKRADTDGKTPSYFAIRVFGNIPIYPYSETYAEEQIQGDVLGSLFCTGDGARRLTIARDFVSLDTHSRRGIREMINEDEWLSEAERRPGDYYPKVKKVRVQHIRDALLKGALFMSPPEWLREKRYSEGDAA